MTWRLGLVAFQAQLYCLFNLNVVSVCVSCCALSAKISSIFQDEENDRFLVTFAT